MSRLPRAPRFLVTLKARFVRAVLLSPTGRQAITEVMDERDPAVLVRPGEEWLLRKPPWDSRGPRVVRYWGNEPRPVIVGPYSSVNDHAILMPGSNHRIDHVTTWVFYDADIPIADQTSSKGPIVIGSDVLVSFDSLVLSGVHIGHGAVVAARSVVTRDVPAYAIVAGVPARVIGWRFEERVREALLRIAWWEWPHEKVVRHARHLASTGTEEFVRRHDPLHGTEECELCPAERRGSDVDVDPR